MTADTNVLVRAAIGDDPEQARLAAAVLREAELIAVPLSTLCEFVWVLRRAYRMSTDDVGLALDRLLAAPNVAYDEQAADHGLAVLRRGGDFADGVITYSGLQLGATEFVTFDRQAARLATEAGLPARVLDSASG
ncbi:MAG: type II toxin-antitoxin system VapC family toxin [Micropruina sp.]